MHRDHGEIAPRGTWNDDNASDPAAGAGHSVNGPYRDVGDTLRARRDALARELAALDRRLDARLEKAREIARIERELRAGTQASWLAPALRSAARTLVTVVIGAALGVGVAGTLSAPRPFEEAAPAPVPLRARYFVSRERLDDALDGRAMGVAPVVEKGSIVGLRLSGLAPADMRDLGLANGDVLLGVDGYDIADADGARIAWGIARSASSFDVLVRRRGALRRVRYDVVG